MPVPFKGDANAVPTNGNALMSSRNDHIMVRRTTDSPPRGTRLLPPRGVMSSRTPIIAPRVDILWSQNDVGFALSPIEGSAVPAFGDAPQPWHVICGPRDRTPPADDPVHRSPSRVYCIAGCIAAGRRAGDVRPQIHLLDAVPGASTAYLGEGSFRGGRWSRDRSVADESPGGGPTPPSTAVPLRRQVTLRCWQMLLRLLKVLPSSLAPTDPFRLSPVACVIHRFPTPRLRPLVQPVTKLPMPTVTHDTWPMYKGLILRLT